MLNGVQVVRGGAALLVALFHVASVSSELRAGDLLKPFLAFGFAGVDLFFVVSGFIMVHANSRHAGDAERRGNFILRRFWRVMPAYWIAWALAAAIFTFIYSFPPPCYRENIALEMLGSFVLAPIGEPHCYIPQAWTLNHELAFYLLFSVFFFLPRGRLWAFAAWAMAALFLAILAEPASTVSRVASIQLMFLLGCASALVPTTAARRLWPLLLTVGFIVFAGAAWLVSAGSINPGRFDQRLAFALAAFFLILGVIGAEDQVRWPRIAVLMGDASYAIYLIHLAAMLPLREMLRPATYTLAGQYVWIASLIVVSIAGGLMFHFFIERPILALRPARRRHFVHAIGSP